MAQFMVMTLAAYNSGIGVPTLIDDARDIYDAAAKCAVLEEKNTAQYVVYTIEQWQFHRPGHAVTVTIAGNQRTASWYPSEERPHPADIHNAMLQRRVDRTPRAQPEPLPIARATQRDQKPARKR